MLITQSNYQAHVPPDSPKLRQSHRQLTDPRLRSVLSLPKFPSNFAYDKELLFAVSGGWGTSQTDGHQGLVMVNVTPPTDANVVGIYNTPGNTSPQFVKVIDESTYMTLGHGVGPGGFEIVNSSDRTALHRIGFYAIPNGARRFEINENTKQRNLCEYGNDSNYYHWVQHLL